MAPRKLQRFSEMERKETSIDAPHFMAGHRHTIDIGGCQTCRRFAARSGLPFTLVSALTHP
jgi:hypothetical protein